MKTQKEIEKMMEVLKNKAHTYWDKEQKKYKIKNVYAYGQYLILKRIIT